MFSDKNERKARDLQIEGLDKGFGYATDLFGQGRDQLTGAYGDARSWFEPLTPTANAGFSAYGDASGANGPEGLARAKALFTSTPGYMEGLNQGLDAIDRRAASRGMLGSGNTNVDTMRFATDYANQQYGNYMAGLAPYNSVAPGMASNQASNAMLYGDQMNGITVGPDGTVTIGGAVSGSNKKYDETVGENYGKRFTSIQQDAQTAHRSGGIAPVRPRWRVVRTRPACASASAHFRHPPVHRRLR